MVKIDSYPKLVFLNLVSRCAVVKVRFRQIRRLNLRDSPLGRSLVSTDLTSDGISATGGPQRFAPEDDTEVNALRKTAQMQH